LNFKPRKILRRLRKFRENSQGYFRIRQTQIKYLELIKRLMKRSRKKIKLTEIENLNPENTKKFFDEK
jgi:hypothetical protein